MTETGHLRALQEGDLDLILRWRNHPQVRRYMFHSKEIGSAGHRRWYEMLRENPLVHAFVFEDGSGPAGFVRLDERGSDQRTGEWGFYVSPEAQRGTGRLMGKAAISHAFKVLNWHRLAGWTLADNDRSIKMHLALGFRQEGLLREFHRIGETYCDVCCFGLLRSEWSITKE